MYIVDTGVAEVKEFRLLPFGSRKKVKNSYIESREMSNIFGMLWPPMWFTLSCSVSKSSIYQGELQFNQILLVNYLILFNIILILINLI